MFFRKLIVLSGLLVAAVQVHAISFSGKITLPSPAPSNISFDVTAFDDAGLESASPDSITVLMGQSSASYLTTGGNNTGSNWFIEATCTANCTDYMDFANYSNTSPGNSTVNPDQISFFPGGMFNHTNVDFSALLADNISGTVTFPAGFPAPAGGIELHINTVDKNKPFNGWYELVGNEEVVSPPTTTSFMYSSKVVKNPSGELVVEVYCPADVNTGGECDEYMTSIYATPQTTYEHDNATILAGGADHTGIDIDILKANSIAGEISLPSGVAPVGGVDVAIEVLELESPYRFGAYVDVNIPQGSSNAQYAAKVPASETVNLAVMAECLNNCGSYVSESYYSTSGSTNISGQATRLPNTQDYSNINFALVEKYAGAAPMCDVLLDNFSGSSLDMEDWYTPESVRYISGGKLVSGQKLVSNKEVSTFYSSQRFRLDFSGWPNNYEANIAITEADLTASGKGVAAGTLGGTFYNALFANPDDEDETGDVFASVSIGDRGAGLEAWWSIVQSTHETFEDYTVFDSGTLVSPGTLMLNTEYVVKIEYNGSNGFTFSANGVMASQNGPATVYVDLFYGFRRLEARAGPEDNMDTDPISSFATFDDVKVDGMLYDDFAASEIDPAKWRDFKAKRQLDSGKLRLEVLAPDSDWQSVNAYPEFSKYKDATCLQATLNLQSSSDIPSGTRGRLRIDGYWYNSAMPYNGVENAVWAQLILEQTESGDLRAVAYAENVEDIDHNTSTELFWHEFSTTIAFNADYVVAIKLEKDKKRMLFRLDNEVFEFPIQTQIHPAPHDEDYNQILARVQSGPGEVHGLVDEVYITPAIHSTDCDFYNFKAVNGNAITVCL